MHAEPRRDCVLLFDIDGTLVRTGGAGGRALNAAWQQLFGDEDAFRDVSFVGSTDERILDEVFLRWRGDAGSPDDRRALLDRYLAFLPRELATGDYVVNPGVREALAVLSLLPHVSLGLATGNVEKAARMKLTPGALNSHFAFGGFGSDARDRADLTEIGVQRGEARLGRAVSREEVVVVGDSVYDVRAAQSIGARSVAVCTGWTDASVLAAENPTLLLDALDTDLAWLHELDLIRA
jgi:phosphoglycolate phosphatase-like HAD superfamily hydrolase